MNRLFIKVSTDPALAAVMDAIEANGNRAYVVGGAVRNALLGEVVGDIDLATDATPDEIIRLAHNARLKTVPTGLDHGTITVVSQGRGFEVTTFRRDIQTDGRHAVVAFSKSLEEDARRRDFTMNALYADRAGDVVDPIGGLPDLMARRLRFVGSPEQRIREDYLRILRFFRFLAWYAKDADPEAVSACAELKDGLAQIAKERIGQEIRKLLAAPDPTASVTLMQSTGVLDQILTDAKPDALEALIRIEQQQSVAPTWPRRLAVLSDSGDASKNLRLSKAETRAQTMLANAMVGNWSLDEAGYRLGLSAATDYALVAAAKGLGLHNKWQEQIAFASHAKLPISARMLHPELEGMALGRGLNAAEAQWIKDGFATPVSELRATALRAGAQE